MSKNNLKFDWLTIIVLIIVGSMVVGIMRSFYFSYTTSNITGVALGLFAAYLAHGIASKFKGDKNDK
jgi:uncharacterized protein involved in cysteine biosynthesis